MLCASEKVGESRRGEQFHNPGPTHSFPAPRRRRTLPLNHQRSMINYGAKELANAYRTVRGNTIQIARDIPEGSYGVRPAPGARSVSEVLRHLVYASGFYEDIHAVRRITSLQGYDFGAVGRAASAKEREPLDKDGIIAKLESEGERVAAWLESLSDDFLNE